jgi:hypothetical protein
MTAVPTRPTGEQLRFRSQYSGDHVLDTYLEAAEKGGRTLADLLDDLFDSNGVFRDGNFEFRYNPSTSDLEYRVGQFANDTDGWTKIIPLLEDAGTFSSATAYENLQIVTDSVGDVYITHGLSSPSTFADESAFQSSGNTTKIVSVSLARDWAIKTDAAVEGTDFSAKYNANLAQTARTAAEAARDLSLSYRDTTLAARDLTLSYRDTTLTYRNEAQSARDLALTYRDAAQTAQGAAEDARDLALGYRDEAETHKNAAAAILDSFDDRYLGAKASDPTLDNDGNPLVVGALY